MAVLFGGVVSACAENAAGEPSADAAGFFPDAADASVGADVMNDDRNSANQDASFVERTAVCDAVVTAYCNAVTACDCPASVADDCELDLRRYCTTDLLSPAVVAAIQAGTITYDGFAARRLIDSLASSATTCGDIVDTLDWNVAEYLTSGGMLIGSLPSGSRCTIEYGILRPSDCDRGLCLEEAGELKCFGIVGHGEQCVDGVICADLTEALDARFPLDDDLANPCIGTTTTTPGLCSPRGATGARCTDDFECLSRRCDNLGCALRLADGEICTRRSDCENLHCADGPADDLCAAGQDAIGAACTVASQCASDVCFDDRCQAAVCRPLTGGR